MMQWKIFLSSTQRFVSSSYSDYREDEKQIRKFQRPIENSLKRLIWTLSFQDDALVHGRSRSQRKKRWKAITDRLKKKGFTIIEIKSGIILEKITFLVFKYSGSGIKPDDHLVKNVSKLQHFQNVKKIEQFCGLINFYGRFISNFISKLPRCLI